MRERPKLPIEFAGYVKPGPARTPIVKFSESAIERAKKKAEGWKKLCASTARWWKQIPVR